MYAQPNYPYDAHSVWNRNQLGSLGNTGTLIVFGIAAYFAYRWMKKRS